MRFFWTVVGGVAARVVGFVAFNILFIEWAVRRYPQHNSNGWPCCIHLWHAGRTGVRDFCRDSDLGLTEKAGPE